MLRLLFLLLLLLPLIEVYLFIQVGSVFGALPTIALCLLTAGLGMVLFRLQGLQTLRRAQDKVRLGEAPAIDLIEGVILILAGLLLLTPGFFTDIAGLVCLLPGVRTRFAYLIINRIPGIQANRADPEVVIIEGEFWEERDKRLR
jgi:UPF0716 protein FxsA